MRDIRRDVSVAQVRACAARRERATSIPISQLSGVRERGETEEKTAIQNSEDRKAILFFQLILFFEPSGRC